VKETPCLRMFRAALVISQVNRTFRRLCGP